MEIYTDLGQLAGQEVALAIGTFDGVHRGHQHLIGQMRTRAQAQGWRSAVLTFEPHPRFLFWPDNPPTLLCTDAEKRTLLARTGVDIIIALPFTRELAANDTWQFAKMLTEHLQVRELWEGPDFTMGSDLLSVEHIAHFGEELGFGLRLIDKLAIAGATVSSSAIREAITEGRMAQAATMLGRYYSVQSTVVHGAQRGRKLGYPTANLNPPPHLAMPNNGIYATFAYLGDIPRPQSVDGRLVRVPNFPRPTLNDDRMKIGVPLPSATNVGYRPMFADGSRNIETYIFDFDADIYDRELRVAFVDHQRGEAKFDSLEQLITQMGADCRAARATLDAVLAEDGEILRNTEI